MSKHGKVFFLLIFPYSFPAIRVHQSPELEELSHSWWVAAWLPVPATRLSGIPKPLVSGPKPQGPSPFLLPPRRPYRLVPFIS